MTVAEPTPLHATDARIEKTLLPEETVTSGGGTVDTLIWQVKVTNDGPEATWLFLDRADIALESVPGPVVVKAEPDFGAIGPDGMWSVDLDPGQSATVTMVGDAPKKAQGNTGVADTGRPATWSDYVPPAVAMLIGAVLFVLTKSLLPEHLVALALLPVVAVAVVIRVVGNSLASDRGSEVAAIHYTASDATLFCAVFLPILNLWVAP